MEPLIQPIDKALIRKELNSATFLRYTAKANNEIHIITPESAPNTLRELGRLREFTFREANAGTGKEVDLDHFDLEDKACQQLMVWDPENEDIIGGYRFTKWAQASFKEDGQPWVNTAHIFHFTPEFIQGPFADVIEMARAWVQPKYRSREMGRKSLYALDNLWDGIGGLIAKHPEVKYLAGKVSLFVNQPEKSRNAVIYFMDKYLSGGKSVVPKRPEIISPEDKKEYDTIFTQDDAIENYKLLAKYVKSHQDSIPPMINMYFNLSPTMQTFGTVCDPDFGEVYDTFMMITLDDVYPDKKDRYVNPYFEMNTYKE